MGVAVGNCTVRPAYTDGSGATQTDNSSDVSFSTPFGMNSAAFGMDSAALGMDSAASAWSLPHQL